jgi:hypothetical protein
MSGATPLIPPTYLHGADTDNFTCTFSSLIQPSPSEADSISTRQYISHLWYTPDVQYSSHKKYYTILTWASSIHCVLTNPIYVIFSSSFKIGPPDCVVQGSYDPHCCPPRCLPNKMLTNFTFLWPCCIVTDFFIIKPTRCTNKKNLFWHETLHVSDSSSVYHQEFIHCTLSSGICHTAL